RRPGDGFRLATFLGTDPRIGASSVDHRQHRQREPLRHLHEAHRLAVALRSRHSEVMADAGFGVMALFLTDDHNRLSPEPSRTTDYRPVLAKLAVAGERREVLDHRFDVVAEMRPVRMPGDLRLLPR